MRAPNSQQIKLVLAGLLKHGDLTKLAELDGVRVQAISQQLNPNLDTKCAIAESMSKIEKICIVNRDAGRGLRALFMDFFDSCLTDNPEEKPDELLGEVSQDFAQLFKDRLKHLPIHVVRADALKAQADIGKFVESLGPEAVEATA